MATLYKVTDGSDHSPNSQSKIPRDIRSDMHGVVDKIADATQPAVDRLVIGAHTQVDKVSDAITDVSEQVMDKRKQLVGKYRSFAASGRGHVRDYPATSILFAIAAGFGLSKLLGAYK